MADSGSMGCGEGRAPNLGPEAARGKCAGGTILPFPRRRGPAKVVAKHGGNNTMRATPGDARPPRRPGAGRGSDGRPRRAGGDRPGQVPGPADPPDHPLAARRLGRRAAPLARRTRRPQARRDDRGGEPRRRVRHARRPVPDHPGAAGRLHHQPDAPLHHPAPLHRPHAALGPGGGLHPHHRPDRLAVRRRREGGRADQDLGRLPGLRPRQPRPASPTPPAASPPPTT